MGESKGLIWGPHLMGESRVYSGGQPDRGRVILGAPELPLPYSLGSMGESMGAT